MPVLQKCTEGIRDGGDITPGRRRRGDRTPDGEGGWSPGERRSRSLGTSATRDRRRRRLWWDQRDRAPLSETENLID
ncbi:hypothetical protein CLOP_g12034 [Closterium sp. NIES-67]|nr:hypothetical protein CLOP_g12034 [Closterium sp. NIES-67]